MSRRRMTCPWGLALVTALAIVLLPACSGGGDESGAKRFDRVTVFNMTPMDALNVHVKLVGQPGELWWAAPGVPGDVPGGIQQEGGFVLDTIPGGDAAGRALNHAMEEGLPSGVHQVVCMMDVDPDGPGPMPSKHLECVVSAGDGLLHTATFYLLPVPGDHPDVTEEPRVMLVGEGQRDSRLIQEYQR